MTMESGTPPVEATKTSARVLGAINRHPVGVTELADQLDMHRSTVYKHLSTMEQIGYISKTDKGYRLGQRLIQLGEAATRQDCNYEQARKVIDQLAETTGEIAGLSIEYGYMAYDMYTARVRSAVSRDAVIADPHQLHCTATGKAILSRFSEDQFREYLRTTDLVAHTDQTITDPKLLSEEIDRVRDRGVAFDREEHSPNIRSVAIPFYNEGPEVTGAVYVLGSADNMSSKRFEEDIPGMLQGALEKITWY